MHGASAEISVLSHEKLLSTPPSPEGETGTSPVHLPTALARPRVGTGAALCCVVSNTTVLTFGRTWKAPAGCPSFLELYVAQ